MVLTGEDHRPLSIASNMDNSALGEGILWWAKNHDTDRLDYLAWSGKKNTAEMNVKCYT